jgi:hypothetical protein
MLNQTGAVERQPLVEQQVGQFIGKCSRALIACEVALLTAPAGDRVDDAPDQLLEARLALGRTNRAAEVLLHDHVRRHLRPRLGELDAFLLEHHRAVGAGDGRIALLPFDGIEWIDPLLGEVTLDLQPRPLGLLLMRALGCQAHFIRYADLLLQHVSSPMGLAALNWLARCRTANTTGRAIGTTTFA